MLSPIATLAPEAQMMLTSPRHRCMAYREALKEPLLANGAADEEAPLLEQGTKVPPPAASSSADDEDEDEEGAEDGLGLRLKHLWSSPAMATACCIFLCFILKVVQQVRRLFTF